MNASRTIEQQHRLVPKLETTLHSFCSTLRLAIYKHSWPSGPPTMAARVSGLWRGALSLAPSSGPSHGDTDEMNGEVQGEKKGGFNMKSEEIHNALQFAGGAN